MPEEKDFAPESQASWGIKVHGMGNEDELKQL